MSQQPPPPPYSLFEESSTPSIAISTHQGDLKDPTLSQQDSDPGPGSLFPPLLRPSGGQSRPRPVSWNPTSSEVPFFPPPPGHTTPSVDPVDLRASVSGPLIDPFAPVSPLSPINQPLNDLYVPPSPLAKPSRPASYAPASSEKPTGYFDGAYQTSTALYEPVEKPEIKHEYVSQQSTSSASFDPRPSLPPRPVSISGIPQTGTSFSPLASPTVGAPLSATVSTGGLDQHMAGLSMAGPVVFAGNNDQLKSSYGRRFMSNMTVTRIGRAGWQSTMSTVSLPFYLSPWGDNNPVTLPNIRIRDVALAGVAFVGASMMLPSDLTAVETGAKWAGKFVVEQLADEAIHHMSKEKPVAVVGRAGVSSVSVKISHKMIGEHAVLRLEGMRQAADYTCCAKGWFAPYLYASGRATRLERNKDFEWASVFSPGLQADTKVAPTLLKCAMQAKQSNVIPYCAWESPTPARAHFSRIAIFFLGISPYRSQAWSQARIPNEARLQFHLLSGVPVVVLPVTASTPICAWSGHTLKQLWDGAFSVDAHLNATLDFLQTIIDVPGLDKQWQEDWRTSIRFTLKQMFDGAMFLRGGHHILAKEVDTERTGMVFFRY